MSVRHPAHAIRDDLSHEQRFPALEGLRGVAIIGVVLYHAVRIWVGSGSWNGGGTHPDKVPEALWWLATGRLGVDLLFVLSGFLVYRSWESIRHHAATKARALGTYAFRRGQRIYPAYWLSLAVFSVWLAPDLLHLGNWRQLLLFIPAQAYWVRGLPDQVNTVYWTLTTELLFYALLPILALGLRRRPWPVWLASVALSYAWVHGELEGVRGDLGAGFIGGRLDQFVIGAVISVLLARAEAGQEGRAVRWARHRAVPWIALGAVLWLGQLQGSMLSTARHDLVAALLHPALALSFAAMTLHLTQRPVPRWMTAHWLRFTALVSYSIYLWHYPILFQGFEAAGTAGDGLAPTPVKLAVLAALIGVIWLVATASYLVAERSAIRARTRRSGAPQRG
jgi:peptidoglycan/LPS O-acetylase OafA/YrhL